MARRILSDKEKAERDAEKVTRFKTVAPKRVNNALDAIARLRQLSASSYSSTEEQRNAIVKALEAEVQKVALAFAGKGDTGGFQLPG
jgi:hypothetical protein